MLAIWIIHTSHPTFIEVLLYYHLVLFCQVYIFNNIVLSYCRFQRKPHMLDRSNAIHAFKCLL